MPNGRPGDNPITDVTEWNLEVFGAETDTLIREIAAFTTDYGAYDPFEEVEDLLWEAENDRSKTPELNEALADLLVRLRSEADSASAT